MTDDKIAVPSYWYDQAKLYGLDLTNLVRVAPPVYKKDRINPANLNYRWKGHPVL